ncbi:hypothetical protein JCM5353_004214 [Sporobolomyces roseus]
MNLTTTGFSPRVPPVPDTRGLRNAQRILSKLHHRRSPPRAQRTLRESLQHRYLHRIWLFLRLRQHQSRQILVNQNSRALRNEPSEMGRPLRPPVRHLHDLLARSSTLETVIIPGLPSPALIEILSPTGIVGFLPPSVVTLLINAEAGIDTIVRLVQSLPLTTGIKTLKTRSAGGDLMQLQQECKNRAIRLMSA